MLRRAHVVGTAALLVESTSPSSCRSEATAFTALVYGLADPVDSGVSADCLVLDVDQDNLKVFVSRILIDPVGVQHAKVGASSAHTALSNGSERAVVLQVVNTLMGWLSVNDSLFVGALAASTSNANAVDDKTLLGLVPEAASLIGTSGSRATMDDRKLPVLPASDPQEESKHIRLLLLP